MSEMYGRTAECWHTYKIGKVLHECTAFLRARIAFGFENLITLRAEHVDAARDIKGIEGLLFRNRLNGGEKMVLKI